MWLWTITRINFAPYVRGLIYLKKKGKYNPHSEIRIWSEEIRATFSFRTKGFQLTLSNLLWNLMTCSVCYSSGTINTTLKSNKRNPPNIAKISDVEKCQTEGFDWQYFIRTDKKKYFCCIFYCSDWQDSQNQSKWLACPKRFQHLCKINKKTAYLNRYNAQYTRKLSLKSLKEDKKPNAINLPLCSCVQARAAPWRRLWMYGGNSS